MIIINSILLLVLFVLCIYLFKKKKKKEEIQTLTKNYLDLIGLNYNIPRIPGETDKDFKKRMTSIITKI